MFQVGQRVMCVSGFSDPLPFETPPALYHIYTVREVVFQDGACGLRLAEIANPVFPYGNGLSEVMFNAEGFQPVDDSKLDVFRAMLEPGPHTMDQEA